MGLKWFVQREEGVDGPLSTEDVQTRLQTGQFSSQNLIWGRGLPAWQRLEWWMRELPRLATAQQIQLEPEHWHFAYKGKSYGPFSKDSLAMELKSLNNLGEVMVWTKGMKEWAPLFEFHEILNAIGVNKRQFPRAELDGKAVIKTVDATLIGRLVAIGEGGCGLIVEGGLVPGQPVTLELQSSAFREVLSAKAEVRYVSGQVAGMKFTNMSMENKGAIISFVRQSQTRFVIKSAA
jgi:hypothetical protein